MLGAMLTRRGFLLLLAAVNAKTLRAGVLVPSQHASLWRGLRFGEKETSHTARLLGRDFALRNAPSQPAETPAFVIHGPVVTITANNETFRLTPTEKGKVAWHPRLTKFGAGELNERFLKDTKHEMDEQAWLGWVAVKIVAEAMLRGRELAKIKIDGHKGVPLYFRNGQLVQPLYDA
jgi:hypothetical protein